MIVIYTQNETYFRDDADTARSILTSVYGAKLGEQAYAAVKDAQIGASYRKYAFTRGGKQDRIKLERH